MKLPLNETNPGADPSGSGDQGSGTISTMSAQGGGNPSSARQPTNGTTGAETDFSEYMWMEHMEDYDQEVLKELHEEETMNYYCDLFEEAQANGPLRGSHRIIAMNPPPDPTIGMRNGADSLSDRFNRSLNFSRPLNPEAAEFVPRFSTSSDPPPTTAQMPPPDEDSSPEEPNPDDPKSEPST